LTRSGSRKPFLSPEALERAVSEVLDRASRSTGPVRAALVGGFALQLLGSDRLTGDVDVVADGPIEGLAPGKALSFGGYESETREGVPVDVIVRNDEFRGLYEEALSAAEMKDGLSVVRPEYLVAMKMVAGRDRDALDLRFLLTHPHVDPGRTKDIVRRHLGPYAARELDVLRAEAEWRASREQER
jgi:hypothetical protein